MSEFITKILGMPLLASKHGEDVDKLLFYVHLLMGILFVGWLAYFLYALFRFRAARSPRASYVGAQTHASTYIEAAVAAIEGVLLIGLSIPLWAKFADAFPTEAQATSIRVVAEQFAWRAVYPGKDGQFGNQDFRLVSSANPFGFDPADPLTKDNFVGDMNDIKVPADKPVIAHITSKDVIHSFKVAPLRVCQDAIPGMSIPIWFQPTKEGKFIITCAQLCGNSHYFMKGFFSVLGTNQWDEFVASKAGAAGAVNQSFE
ncbi:MAG TPA: cytochrome c oxidase subunit II [Candidatus Kapabacteria bacterium]|nr:cytochrome c oxidase subunit II [Candidatus Kapabacteria bacterium]